MRFTSFADWFRRMTVVVIRRSESPQPFLLPSGGRLRGIALGRGIYLARDRKFYEVTGQATVLRAISEADVQARLPLPELLRNYDQAVKTRLQVRRRQQTRARVATR